MQTRRAANANANCLKDAAWNRQAPPDNHYSPPPPSVFSVCRGFDYRGYGIMHTLIKLEDVSYIASTERRADGM